jgi:signal transduction histidine kinase/FixJ family two-component response regulator
VSDIDGLKLLRRIEEGVAGKSGEAFFRQIVQDIAGALNAHAAFTSQLLSGRRAAMKAFWLKDHYAKCTEYLLDGTPCEFVYAGRITAYARNIGEIFPVDREWFAELGVHSYLGIPIKNEAGEVFGHIAVMDTRERDWHDADLDVLRLFSLRTAVELERARAQRQLEESNESLRLMNEQLSAEITRRTAMQEQLAAAKLAAESANQAKSVFISQMSHELRTPLNGILGYTQLLKRSEQLSQQQRDGLDVIERSGEHLLHLVNDLLDLARIESGKVELHEENLDLPTLLQHVRDLIAVRADKAGLQFDYRADQLPEYVRADARALRQILLNLLGNAVKFTNAGGRIGLQVSALRSTADQYLLQFRIADSGVGIPADQRTRIFEPFHRVQDPDRPAEGTGLGLAITKRLVEAMHGKIELQSAVGVGTTFLIEIAVAGAVSARQTSVRQPVIVGYGGQQRDVIVVDDDAANRQLVCRLLADLDFDVRCGSNGEEALQLLAQQPADLLITDLVMPRVGGLELARRLRSQGDHRPKLIAISASASGCTTDEALQAGCDAFVPKPLKLSDLLDTIGNVLSLEWCYDATPAATSQASIAVAVDFTPSWEHAQELYHLALLGDITALLDRASAMFDGAPEAGSFVAQLRILAEQYDTGAIRQLLSAAHASIAPAH